MRFEDGEMTMVTTVSLKGSVLDGAKEVFETSPGSGDHGVRL